MVTPARAILLAALLAPAALAAQATPASTGQYVVGNRDQRWTVYAGVSPDNLTFLGNAYIPTNYPWSPATGSNLSWISATSDGNYNTATSSSFSLASSLNAVSSSFGGAAAYYRFEMSFDLTGYDPTATSLEFKCATDNTFGGLTLNGIAENNVDCPFNDFAGAQSYVLNADFADGINTLAFSFSGDGITDGFIFETVSFSAPPLTTTVPEPATVALVGSGLAGMVVRRRKQKQP